MHTQNDRDPWSLDRRAIHELPGGVRVVVSVPEAAAAEWGWLFGELRRALEGLEREKGAARR